MFSPKMQKLSIKRSAEFVESSFISHHLWYFPIAIYLYLLSYQLLSLFSLLTNKSSDFNFSNTCFTNDLVFFSLTNFLKKA